MEARAAKRPHEAHARARLLGVFIAQGARLDSTTPGRVPGSDVEGAGAGAGARGTVPGATSAWDDVRIAVDAAVPVLMLALVGVDRLVLGARARAVRRLLERDGDHAILSRVQSMLAPAVAFAAGAADHAPDDVAEYSSSDEDD